MRIRIEHINPTVGDIRGNKELILSSLRKAEEAGTDLLILTEMVLTGYPVQDLIERESFREACYQTNREIIEATRHTALLFGSITPNNNGWGRKMFNSALLAREGSLQGTVHKTLLPTYDVFDDLRYFEPNSVFECLTLNGVKLGVTICEDIWYNQNEVQYHTYDIDPARMLKEAGAQIIINISASPFTKTKHENRKSMLKKHARDLHLPLLYCNQVGAHTDIVFDGDSMAISAEAKVVATTSAFQPSFTDVVWDSTTCMLTAEEEKTNYSYPSSKEERQFEAIRLGLRDYLIKTGISGQVILGLSGGIDSALVCALAVETLGIDRVKAITMPSKFSSEGSVTDSQQLAENLGIPFFEIPIGELYEQANRSLKPLFEGYTFGVAEENLQSRIRGMLLMATSNKFGDFLLATGNKSEYAVGYATLYGDMNGALAIIGDLYKTEVYDMARWLNESYYKREVIPYAILDKPPSAELRPGQKDSDSLPDYPILDNILYRYIELQESPETIISSGHVADTVHQIVRLVDLNEFKRFQAAPILKLSSKSFGTGRRWPMVQRWTK